MEQKTEKKQHRLTRRDFLRYGWRLGLVTVLGWGFFARTRLTVENVQLAYPSLPSSFRGFRIVQISDLHTSFWIDGDYLKWVVNRINAMSWDMVTVTGDFITGAVNSFWQDWLPVSDTDYLTVTADALRGLKAGDKFSVLGNHDQGHDTERVVKALEGAGFEMLRNEAVRLTRNGDTIYIAGTDDFWYTGDLSRTLRNIPEDAFTVLLSHNPDIVGDFTEAMTADLTLSGHTHGGQIYIPYLSRFVLPIRRPERYRAGLVREPWGYTYVNRGLGTLVFPFRLFAPPEITVVTLV